MAWEEALGLNVKRSILGGCEPLEMVVMMAVWNGTLDVYTRLVVRHQCGDFEFLCGLLGRSLKLAILARCYVGCVRECSEDL